MPVIEKNVLINKGNNIIYPISKAKNILCNDEETVEEKLKNIKSIKTFSITLLATSWTKNNSTNQFEYNYTNSSITNKMVLLFNMDIANQKKFKDGDVTSYNGGFKIKTSVKPTQNITALVIILEVE